MSDQTTGNAPETSEQDTSTQAQTDNATEKSDHMIPKSRFDQVNAKLKESTVALENLAKELLEDVPDSMRDLVSNLPAREKIQWIRNATKKGVFGKSATSGPDNKRLLLNQIQVLADETFSDIVGRTDKMREDAVHFLREEFSQRTRQAAGQGIHMDKPIKELGKVFLEKAKTSQFEIIDRAGRHWNSNTNTEIYVQTYRMNTVREAKMQRLLQMGFDVVTINKLGSDDGCKNWEVREIALTTEAAQRENLTFVNDLPKREIFHRNCRHSFGVTAKIMQERNTRTLQERKGRST